MKTSIPIAVSALLVATPLLANEVADDQAKARENFQQADADNDGELTPAEFREFINANADDGLGRAGMVRRFGAYDTAFGRIDKNEDGLVTPAELSAARRN
ncbi:EF-hand domain-containing protein [Erythrobacter sp. Alg231-14]|uniref:EF-hand domain-containing protein n=1 Tax=Erythrobacter sp. Alg231-14 TaxID=1922225 RepID=UPI000D5543B4